MKLAKRKRVTSERVAERLIREALKDPNFRAHVKRISEDLSDSDYRSHELWDEWNRIRVHILGENDTIMVRAIGEIYGEVFREYERSALPEGAKLLGDGN